MLSGEWIDESNAAKHITNQSQIVVLFLATFVRIGGPEAVTLVAEEWSRRIATAAARFDIGFLRLAWHTYCLVLDKERDEEMITAAVIEISEADDVEIGFAEWAEVRLAVGHAVVEDDLRSAIVEGVEAAQDDLASRFPEEWYYPITVV
jgi:hypothetical protein